MTILDLRRETVLTADGFTEQVIKATMMPGPDDAVTNPPHPWLSIEPGFYRREVMISTKGPYYTFEAVDRYLPPALSGDTPLIITTGK